MNLHRLARGAIQTVNPDRRMTLFRSLPDKVTDARGIPTAMYAPGVEVMGQVQSESDAALAPADRVNQNTITRRIWLFADADAASRPWGVWRPLARSGDIIHDDAGGQWYVDAVVDDFSPDGWVSLRATLQTVPRALLIKAEDSP